MIQTIALYLYMAIPISMVVIAPICILYEYCIEPKKSLREGLSDWWNESCDDL